MSLNSRQQILTWENAVNIYERKIQILHSSSLLNNGTMKGAEDPLKGRSTHVSSTFRVSPKTVRNV